MQSACGDRAPHGPHRWKGIIGAVEYDCPGLYLAGGSGQSKSCPRTDPHLQHDWDARTVGGVVRLTCPGKFNTGGLIPPTKEQLCGQITVHTSHQWQVENVAGTTDYFYCPGRVGAAQGFRPRRPTKPLEVKGCGGSEPHTAHEWATKDPYALWWCNGDSSREPVNPDDCYVRVTDSGVFINGHAVRWVEAVSIEILAGEAPQISILMKVPPQQTLIEVEHADLDVDEVEWDVR